MRTDEADSTFSRRDLLGCAITAGLVAASGLSLPAIASQEKHAAMPRPLPQKGKTMSFVKTQDGAEIFYKDWGAGPVVMFSHGWPLNADAWEDQLFALASNGYRVIAHDRRSHGRSSQTWNGNDMDTYADDLAAVVRTLDVHDVTHVGHSTGGGEVARYIGRHGCDRVKRAVLVSAIPPTMLRTSANPDGLPIAVFDGLRRDLLADRSQFYRDLAEPFYGANRAGAKVSQGIKDAFWQQSMMAGLKGAHDCIREFSESVFHEDLKKFEIPTLLIHGDDDQIVPIDDAARKSVKLITGATLKVYPGAPHGIPATHHEELVGDLLAIMRT